MRPLPIRPWPMVLSVPALRLRSSAGRYRHPLAVRPVVRRAEGPWGRQTRVSAPLPRPEERDDRLARVEAVLLLAREPLHPRRLARFAHLTDGTEARTMVLLLRQLYDREQRAFYVAEIGGGYQLRTRRQFAPWLRRLQHIPPEIRLTQPALETLAVIAYRQPIVRAEVDAIRGVHCSEVIRQLMERDLVRVAGRSEEIGRPYLYGTTRKFLQVFGFRDLSDLPRADLLRLPAVTFPGSEPGREEQRGQGDRAVTFMSGASVMEEKRVNPLGDVTWEETPSVHHMLLAENEDEEWDDEAEGDEEDDDDEEDEEWDDDDEWDDEDDELDAQDADEDEDWEEDEDEWEEVEDSDENWEEEGDEEDDDDEDEDEDEDWEEDEED